MYAAYQSHQSCSGAAFSKRSCRSAVSRNRSAREATSMSAATMSVVPDPAGEPGRDLLEQPAVAVRVAERRVREIRAPRQVGEAGGLRLVLHLADVDAAADEIFSGSVDVLDSQVQPVKGSGLHRREALAEMDRALRVGRRHLHQPDVVADGKVGVQSPSETLIKALGPIDIRDGDRHHLESHIDRPDFRRLRRTGTAYFGAHVYLRWTCSPQI